MEMLKAGCQTSSKRAQKRRVSGLLLIAFFIALPVAPRPVSAQVECLGVCEAQFEACLREQGSGPQPTGGGCQLAYEACVDACLGQYARILS